MQPLFHKVIHNDQFVIFALYSTVFVRIMTIFRPSSYETKSQNVDNSTYPHVFAKKCGFCRTHFFLYSVKTPANFLPNSPFSSTFLFFDSVRQPFSAF